MKLTRRHFKCINCKTFQTCTKDANYICEDFEYPWSLELDKPRKSKSLCSGCRNDYYNYGEGAQKAIGGSCFSYKTAKVVLESIPFHINHSPPWRLRFKLDCYRRRW